MNNGRFFSTILVATSVAILPAGAASPKLGWAGGAASDHNASNASWYYRWWHTIPEEAEGSLAEFIPLIKYPNNIQDKVDLVAGLPDVDTLLVLNEPERPDQSDTSVQEALSIWPTIQAGLPNHKLVSPSPSDNAEGQAWLESFMNEVESRNGNADPADDLRVDAIAFHWYGASSPNATSAATNFLNRVDWYHTRFNRPVWITEFAMHDWEGDDPTDAMIQANADFLEIVLPELESRSYVERYSYYNWFDDARIFTDSDPAPTVIGDQYVGTTLAGEVRDLAGQSIGTDIAYLRGGELTNGGPALPDAMRAIDALEGANTISGGADWSLAARADAYTRVRPNATLRKTGANTIGIAGDLVLDGDFIVAEGVLRHSGASPSGDGGGIRVDEGATLAIEVGRNLFTVASRSFESAGVVDGVIRFTAGANVTPIGPSPRFTSDVTVDASVMEVGGPGFNAGDPAPLHVTAGLRLEYDAAHDTPGDDVWEEAGGSVDSLMFASASSPIPVVGASLQGVSAAYDVATAGGATGLNGFFETGAPFSRADATFEIVFEVTDTQAGADQVLWEAGGASRGVSFVLDDAQLTFNVDGDGDDIFLSETLAPGWRHAIGVIDLDPSGDTVTLYVDGQPVATLADQTVGDWAGGNVAGLGAGANSVTGVGSGVGVAYHGDIALARYYSATAFAHDSALQNYTALQLGPLYEPTTVHVGGDLVLANGAELRVDLRAGGFADKVAVDGMLSLSAANLAVSLVGDQTPMLGETFDLLDFAAASGEFALLSLPELAASTTWRSDRLLADGVIEVVLRGDFNADGVVDAADYTVWRRTNGTQVMSFHSADSNGDGQVDTADLADWIANYGAAGSPPPSAVPEPATVLLLFIPLLAREARR